MKFTFLPSIFLPAIFLLSSFISTHDAKADLFPKHAINDHQQQVFRGTITPERAWWDLSHYHLDIMVDPDSKSITGTNTMRYKVLSAKKRLQIELQAPMQLTKVEQNGKI